MNPFWRVLWQYSLFEGADSAWSLIVISTYFGAFVQIVLGLPGAAFGWAATIASLAIALISPLLGAMADGSGPRRPYLRLCVAGVVVCTGALAYTHTAWLALPLCAVAYVCASCGFMLFTAMLPAVSSARSVAWIVSLSIGVGYTAGLACITLFSRFVPTDADVGRVFLPMAIVYGLLALPILIVGRDFGRRDGARFDPGGAYARLRATFADARAQRPLFRFLVGNFFAVNAVASVVTLMGLYARAVMGFEARELKTIFAPAIVVAALSAWLVFGPLVRRFGPKRAVLAVLGVWLVLFGSALAIGPLTIVHLGGLTLGGRTLFATVVAPLAGIGLAGLGCTTRVLLTALAPAGRSGEIWGLFALSGRTASIAGDATWSAILTVLGEGAFGYHVALVALAVYILVGAGFILTLPDVRPTAANFAA